MDAGAQHIAFLSVDGADPAVGQLLGRRARTVADCIQDAHAIWEPPSQTAQEGRA